MQNQILRAFRKNWWRLMKRKSLTYSFVTKARQKAFTDMNWFSVVIITLNEEDNIADCIRSVKAFSNDIIVVDAGSDDKTIDIAKEKGAKTFSIDWKGFG